MKVGVLIRGPIRPNAASVQQRIMAFKSHISELGIEPFVFLATWASSVRDTQFDVLQPIIEGALTIELPRHLQDAAINISDSYSGGGSRLNTIKQHYLARAALLTLARLDNFEYIIHTRTDIEIALHENWREWFTPHIYNTIHAKGKCGDFINDQFSIATPSLMLKAWDYGGDEDLIGLVAAATKGEDVLEALIDRSGIIAECRPCKTWMLDQNRHSN